jgi:hypothetical protein
VGSGDVPVMWETRDRRGRVVALLPEIWEHVLGDHADMTGLEALVRSVVEHPDFANRDGRHPDRECVYRQIEDDGMRLKVVVAYSGADGAKVGRVVTSYKTRRVPSKETPLWP